MRYIVTGGILLATIAWLVLSYMPQTAALLPKLAFDAAGAASLFPWLAALTVVVFLAIQFDLVRVTGQWFRQPAHTTVARALNDFGLRRDRELFWTALPVVGTLLLALWLMIVR